MGSGRRGSSGADVAGPLRKWIFGELRTSFGGRSVLGRGCGMAAKSILHRLFRNPNPLWQILLAIPLLFLGWPLTLDLDHPD